MKKEYDFSKGERGKFHNPDGEFIVPKRDMLPLYEFQLRMARAKRENAFADLPKLKEKINKFIDHVHFENLASEEANDE